MDVNDFCKDIAQAFGAYEISEDYYVEMYYNDMTSIDISPISIRINSIFSTLGAVDQTPQNGIAEEMNDILGKIE